MNLLYIPSAKDPADAPSRRLCRSDSCLSLHLWQRLQLEFGSELGHSVDLMALPSNVRPHLDGSPLPFFSVLPSPTSLGINVFAQNPAAYPKDLFRNPYAFPPIILIGQLLRFLQNLHLPCTLVIPDVFPRKYWWPLLCSRALSFRKLASKGDTGVLLVLLTQDFSSSPYYRGTSGCLAFESIRHPPCV